MKPDECRNNLKPCPFCGQTKHLYIEKQKGLTMDIERILCTACDLTLRRPDHVIEHWNSRTESKPVTREEMTRGAFDRFCNSIAGSAIVGEQWFEWTKDQFWAALQLSAPQSPVVPAVERQLPEVDEMVSILQDTLDTLYRRTLYENSDSLGDQLNEGSWDRLKMALDIAKKVKELVFLMEDNAMGISTVDRLAEVFAKEVDSGEFSHRDHLRIFDGIRAIHAHLLATVGRQSHVDLGWIRSLLLNMKPSEIDDVARLIFDTLATGGRDSREDNDLKKELDDLQRKAFNEYVDMANRYRQALDRIYRMVSQVVANPADNDIETFVCIMTDIEALATTGPNDGSGRR